MAVGVPLSGGKRRYQRRCVPIGGVSLCYGLIMTMLSAGGLGVEIDYGAGNPQGTLRRLENDNWEDYRPDGETITSNSLDIESLPPGKYRIHCNEN